MNDIDAKGRGLQVKETYYMQVTHVGESKQRALQRQIDQPMLILYGQGYQAPSSFDSSNTTAVLIDLGVMEKISERIGENMNETEGMTPEQKVEKIEKRLKTKNGDK